MNKYKINKALETEHGVKNYIGKTFSSNDYGNFTVLGAYDRSKKCLNLRYVVEFENTGNQTVVYANRIRSGGVKDYWQPMGNGGILGNFSFEDEPSKNKYYGTWSNMLDRCINKSNVNYRPEGSISERWMIFSNFLDDVKEIVGCTEMKEYPNFKWDIDKDLLVYGNQMYSLETCCFIPNEMNIYISKYKHESKEYKFIGLQPSGSLKFRSQVHYYNGGRYCVPTSAGIYEVHEGYWNKKFEIIY